MSRAFLLSALLIAAASPARAGFGAGDAGTSGAQFLKLGGGARAAGLGEAYAAVADGPDAIYWNPAALTRVLRRSAVFMHSTLPAGINYEFLGYGQKLGSRGALGAGLQHLSQARIQETDSAGFATGGAFRPSDLAASLGCAFTLPEEDLGILSGASLGLTAKYIQSTITRTVSTWAADLGYLSAPIQVLGRDLRVAYVAQNLGGALRFRELSDPLPTNLRLGTSYAASKSWLLALDFNEPLDNRPYVSFGAEYAAELDAARVAARAGINTRAIDRAGPGGLSGLAFGLGARFRRFGVDYAFASLGALGMTHTVSLNFSF